MPNQQPPQDDSTSSVSNSITHELQLQSITPSSNQHNNNGPNTVVHISQNDSATAQIEHYMDDSTPFYNKVVRIVIIGVIALLFIALVISIAVIASIVTLPFLVIAFLVTRFIQLFRHGNGYEATLQHTLTLRSWVYAEMALLAWILTILSSITTRSPGFKSAMLKLLPFANDISIFLITFFFCIHNVLLVNMYVSLMPSLPLAHTESSLYVRAAVLEIIDCVTFWVVQLMVIRAVPTLMHHKLLGLYTRRWITVSILVLISHNVIKISTHLTVWLIRELVCEKLDPGTNENSKRYYLIEKILQRRYIVYYINGIKHNINFLLTSLLLLLTWLLYFGSRLDDTPQTKYILQLGTRTCFTFLTASVLSLIKTCVLLTWEASVVYNRLDWTSKILEGGLQLYFLGIVDRHSYDMFNFLQVGRTPTMYGIQQVCAHFLTAKSKLSEENYTSIILDTVMSFCRDEHGIGIRSIEESLKLIMQSADGNTQVSCGCCRKGRLRHQWRDFENQLRDFMDSSTEITLEILESWTERARSNCLNLANTLSSVKEVADCLNNIISVLLVATTFIFWLLLTRLASTKVFVLIASPLLAATFIFGDTCKILFGGIFFVYVIHPFDVSDLCVIDGIMMEVRTIGIWKTTFAKVGTQEKVMYPNSQLANKNIINHKSDFDWNDYMEFDVVSLDQEKIKILKEKIEQHLEGNKDKFAPNYSWVVVVTTSEDIKLAVYLRHIVDIKHHTNFECLKKKHKLRSEFILYVKSLMDQIRG